MNLKIAITSLTVFSQLIWAEPCEIELLEALEYTDIECQFYMGTKAYRNSVYSVAAAHWNEVLNADIQYEDDAEIQAMALSTLTFLMYHGLGVEQDRSAAVKNWQKAAMQGDLEARRHLGFAYADKQFKGADRVKALGWYESIFLLYLSPDGLDSSDAGIYRDAMEAAEPLRRSLSGKELQAALAFAKSII